MPLLNNPVIISAQPCADDAMLLRTEPVNKAIAYEVRIGTMPGLWRTAGVYKPEPEIRIEGLSPGVEYRISARALGADEVSAWSDQAVCKSIRLSEGSLPQRSKPQRSERTQTGREPIILG